MQSLHKSLNLSRDQSLLPFINHSPKRVVNQASKQATILASYQPIKHSKRLPIREDIYTERKTHGKIHEALNVLPELRNLY